jgi:EAL domain-containing protein (putative c-di-GMP-specific phosphodiesterase class I)
MAHTLGMNTVAEGVERKVDSELLHQFDCDEIQGYYYSKPIQADDFVKFTQNFIRKEVAL